jgi:hypothetical protein
MNEGKVAERFAEEEFLRDLAGDGMFITELASPERLTGGLGPDSKHQPVDDAHLRLRSTCTPPTTERSHHDETDLSPQAHTDGP